MAEPTTIRWQCAKRILELLRDRPDLEGVQIEPGYPGDRIQKQAVWLDGIESAGEGIAIPVSKGPDAILARDDEFHIPLEIRVAGITDRVKAMDRVTEIIAAIEYSFAIDSQLDELDGVIAAFVVDEKQSCGEIRGGPFLAFGEVTIYVRAAAR